MHLNAFALGNGHVDARSDLYSLAVVAYRCLAGVPPFESPGLGELIVFISTHAPPSILPLRPDLPVAVDEWFQRALRKGPSDRFASAKEMAEAFSYACGLAPPPRLTVEPPPPVDFGRDRPVSTSPSFDTTMLGTYSTLGVAKRRAKPKLGWVVAASVAIGAAVVGVILGSRNSWRASAIPWLPVAASEAPSATTSGLTAETSAHEPPLLAPASTAASPAVSSEVTPAKGTELMPAVSGKKPTRHPGPSGHGAKPPSPVSMPPAGRKTDYGL